MNAHFIYDLVYNTIMVFLAYLIYFLHKLQGNMIDMASVSLHPNPTGHPFISRHFTCFSSRFFPSQYVGILKIFSFYFAFLGLSLWPKEIECPFSMPCCLKWCRQYYLSRQMNRDLVTDRLFWQRKVFFTIDTLTVMRSLRNSLLGCWVQKVYSLWALLFV